MLRTVPEGTYLHSPSAWELQGKPQVSVTSEELEWLPEKARYLPFLPLPSIAVIVLKNYWASCGCFGGVTWVKRCMQQPQQRESTELLLPQEDLSASVWKALQHDPMLLLSSALPCWGAVCWGWFCHVQAWYQNRGPGLLQQSVPLNREPESSTHTTMAMLNQRCLRQLCSILHFRAFKILIGKSLWHLFAFW